MKTPLLTLLFTGLLLAGCGGEAPPEDIVQEPDKSRAVETAVSVEPLSDSVHILRTEHKVWVNNAEYKTIRYADTIPALPGAARPPASNGDNQEALRESGRYKIYITVK